MKDPKADTPPPFEPVLVVSHVPWRSPAWKAHTTEGHARRAVAGRPDSQVWRWDFAAGEWVLAR